MPHKPGNDSQSTSKVPANPLDQVPGYELLEERGRGGMGVVYRARDKRLDRDVAVKFLAEKSAADSSAATRFVVEAKITGQLQHPGIPAVHELGTLPDGRPFLAMRLVKGQTLQALLDGRPSPEHNRGRFLAIFEQICHAVDYAHAHRVIHRDLKPSNIMVGAFGEVQVMDWGLAKVLDTSPDRQGGVTDDPWATVDLKTAIDTPRGAGSETRTGSVLGTPAYMPPEQAGGEIRKLDPRSDVFGLGAVLCQILTGRPPYQGKDAHDVRLLAVRGELGDVLTQLETSGAEPDLVALCKRCLAFRQEDRPADAGEVAGAVAALRAAADERARQAELDRVRAEGERQKAELQAQEQRKRRRVWIGLAATLLVGLLALAAGLILLSVFNARLDAANTDLTTVNQRLDAANTDLTTANQQLGLARKEADVRRDEAVAISDFLQDDLLGQADIDAQDANTERKPNITVAELLDRAAAKIEGKFREQPLVEAALRRTLGNSYKALGQFPKAQTLLEASVRQFAENEGAPVETKLGARANLASVYVEQGQWGQAEGLMRDVLRESTAALGSDHEDSLNYMVTLGQLYTYMGKHDLARPIFKEVIERGKPKFGNDHMDVLTAVGNLAASYFMEGKYDQAEPLFVEALEGKTRVFGPNHGKTILTRANLAALYHQQGKLDLAEPHYLAVLKTWSEKLGPEHPKTLTVHANLAALYVNQKKYDKAEPLMIELLRARTQKLGRDHPDTVNSINNLAATYVLKGEPAKALPLNEEFLKLCLTRYGSEHAETIGARAALGNNYLKLGRHAEAGPLLREVLTFREKNQPDHWTTFQAKSRLGEALTGQRKYTEAEPLLHEAYDGMKSREASIDALQQDQLTRALERLIQLYDAWDKPAEAEKWFAKLPAEQKARVSLERQHAWPLLWGWPRF